MTVREQLIQISESSYRKFNEKLLPGIDNILGIRQPILRALAKEVAKGDWRGYLAMDQSLYYEEKMLRGLVIVYVKCIPSERLALTKEFVPTINNWAVCDCFCRKVVPKERDDLWVYIQELFQSEREYELRFAVVMAFKNFADMEHCDRLFKHFENIKSSAYYTQIAIAWAIAEFYIRLPIQTEEYIEGCRLDNWTVNKGIQKITESFRVSDEDKIRLRGLKRK